VASHGEAQDMWIEKTVKQMERKGLHDGEYAICELDRTIRYLIPADSQLFDPAESRHKGGVIPGDL
jgi:hypothetical protein